MGRTGKVEDWHLEANVLKLYKNGEGWSLGKIAKHLNQICPDAGNWSKMDIKRYIERSKNSNALQKFNEGKDIVADFGKELSDKLNNAVTEMDKDKETLNNLLEGIKDGQSVQDITQVIKAITQVQEQQRRNIVSIMQYYNANIRPVAQVTRNQQIKIDSLILNLGREFQDVLCPQCLLKLQGRIVDLVKKEDYEVKE